MNVLPGEYDQSADVRTLETYAIVEGVRREVETVTLDKELTGDLPEQVVSAGGISGSGGTIVWAHEDSVQMAEGSPWHQVEGWPPTGGERVQVYVTDGTTSFLRFTGVIDRTTGTVGGNMQSTIIDPRDQLNTRFTHEALLRHHVPYQLGAESRRIGLRHWYFLVAALREARVFNLPNWVADNAMSATLQGSIWPEYGSLMNSEAVGENANPSFYRAPWGYAAGSFTATYAPRTNRGVGEPVQLAMVLAPDHSGRAYIAAHYESSASLSAFIRLEVSSSWRVTAVLRRHNGDEITVISQSITPAQDQKIVTLLVKNGVWEVRTNDSERAVGTENVTGNSAMDRVVVSASPNTRMAGVQVSRPNTASHEFQPIRFNPNMRFDPGHLASTMDMSRRIEGENVAELVDEITKATLTAAWWDESGVLNLVSTERLWNTQPSQTVTSLDDITDLAWEYSLLGVRSRVDATWKNPSISVHRDTRNPLFRGRGQSVGSGETVEVYAVPGTGEEWFGPHLNPALLEEGYWGPYNRRNRSFVGVHYMDEDGNEIPTTAYNTTITTERVGTVGLKITHAVGELPSEVEASIAVSETSSAVRPRFRGEALPVIRGMGQGVWTDDTATSSIAGPSYAPSLTHDVGYWGQAFFDGGTVAGRLADYIAERITHPVPTVVGLSVTYDPRRQLGDVIWVDAGLLNIRLRALVVGIQESHQVGAHEQRIDIRIISATSTATSYDQLRDAWVGGNYNGLQAVWSSMNYNQFADNPLEGA